MSQDSANEAYSSLIAWLRDNDLAWVADQVEDEVKLGKIRSERISVPAQAVLVDEPTVEPRRQARQTSAEFVGRTDYTPEERCEIVIGAVQAVVVGAVRIQDVLARTLGVDTQDAEIHFVPGETGNVSHSYKPHDVASRRTASVDVEKLFQELEEDVKSAD